MKKDKTELANQFIFYSRNPTKLRQDIVDCHNKSLVTSVLLDYEFKKAVDYGQLSQAMQTISAFTNLTTLYLNFGQCGLNTQKLLLLMRGKVIFCYKYMCFYFFTKKTKQYISLSNKFQSQGCSVYAVRLRQLYLVFENCTNINQEGVEAISKFLLDCGPNLSVLVISLRKVYRLNCVYNNNIMTFLNC
jgi:hypothetical protein